MSEGARRWDRARSILLAIVKSERGGDPGLAKPGLPRVCVHGSHFSLWAQHQSTWLSEGPGAEPDLTEPAGK